MKIKEKSKKHKCNDLSWTSCIHSASNGSWKDGNRVEADTYWCRLLENNEKCYFQNIR